MAIFTGVVWIAGTLIIPETYPLVLLRTRAAKLSKMTGKVYMIQGDIDEGATTLGQALETSLTRPWVLLFKEPIVFLLSIYMAIVYGTLYMLFAAFPIIYQQKRGWSEGLGGLPFLGVAVGEFAALIYNSWDNKRYVRIMDEHQGFAPPEARLPPAMIGGILFPVGMIWFAWTNSPSIHWMAPIAAGAPFGFGLTLVFLAIMNYLIDAYTIFAASCLAANAVIRSLFGAIFPLFTTYMYNNLGIHWASMIPAFLALICVPFPFIFYKYGPRIRQHCPFAAEADAFMAKIRAQGEDSSQSEEDEEEEEKEEEKEKVAIEYNQQTDGKPREEEVEKEIQDAQEPKREEVEEPVPEVIKQVASRPRRPRPAPLTRYESNPYDIDRMNTRESFIRTRSRTGAPPRPSRTRTRSTLSRLPGEE